MGTQVAPQETDQTTDPAELSAAEADAAFSGGFSDADESAPQPTDTTPPVEAEATAELPEVPAEPAPEFVQVTKAELEELKASAAKITTIEAALTKQHRDTSGRMGGVEQTLKELRSAIQQGHAVDISEEDFEELKQEFPDVAKMFVAGMNRAASKRKGSAAPGTTPALVFDPEKIAEIVNGTVEQRVEAKFIEREQVSAMKTVTKAVPDWRQIRDTQEWKDWVMAQPDEKRTMILDSWDPDELIPVFNEFKERNKPASPKPPAPSPKRNRFADGVQPRSVSGTTAQPVEDDFDAGFKAARV